MRSSRSLVLGAALLALALLLGACGSGEDEGDNGDAGNGAAEEKGSLTVGVSGAFAENQIVAEMYAQVLADAGYEVDTTLDIGTREISDPALERGEIDIKPEYLASELLFLDPEATPSADPAEVVAELEPLLAEKGIALLEPSPAQDANAFVVTQETASSTGAASLSDLADGAGDLTLGGPPECPDRPFCVPGLKKTYGIEFAEFQPISDTAARVQALAGGQIDVALLFSTNSQIAANDFVVLEDDQGLQAAENITPVVNEEVLNDEIEELLNAVSAALTTENITELNGRVELDQEDPADVAADFLAEQGLI